MEIGVILPAAQTDERGDTPGWQTVRSFATAAESRGYRFRLDVRSLLRSVTAVDPRDAGGVDDRRRRCRGDATHPDRHARPVLELPEPRARGQDGRHGRRGERRTPDP